MGCHLGAWVLASLAASALAQSPETCAAELRSLASRGISPPDLAADVVGFYKASGYACAWVRDGKITPQARAIVGALNRAWAKGLDPETYDGLRLGTLIAQLGSVRFADGEASRFDLALTVSSMRYVSDLCLGRANPKQLRCDLQTWLQRLLNAKDPVEVLEEVEPRFDGYRRTRDALQTYRMLALAGERVELPVSERPVEPGESYSGAARLATLLRQLGDLPADTLLPPRTEVYEGALVEAVKRFQLRHGLDPDGVIGNKTRQQLNTPMSKRVRQLQLTLERWRWMPRAFPRPPIVVNIPEFRLRALDDFYQTGLEMKVVVGKAYRHRTPTFSSELKSVVFRPYWNVPLSIQRAELVPEVERNRSYLVENGYEVVTARREVVTREIISDEILAKLRAGTLFIRQVPGPMNALGSIAFVFPNVSNVYLHDTPARHLFSRSRRDFSHGCIRVENAVDLAVWALKENPQWPRARIIEAIGGVRRIQVDLAHPIPILIVYGTVVVPEDGNPRFFEDLYGLDALLDRQLPHPPGAPASQ